MWISTSTPAVWWDCSKGSFTTDTESIENSRLTPAGHPAGVFIPPFQGGRTRHVSPSRSGGSALPGTYVAPNASNTTRKTDPPCPPLGRDKPAWYPLIKGVERGMSHRPVRGDLLYQMTRRPNRLHNHPQSRPTLLKPAWYPLFKGVERDTLHRPVRGDLVCAMPAETLRRRLIQLNQTDLQVNGSPAGRSGRINKN
jgi:hypothetical protein